MTIPTRLAIALATLIGGGALAMLGLFLFLGPFGRVDLGLSIGERLAWDAALCLAFCVQHSVMVRRGFRSRLARIVPPHYHGAFYTLASAIVLLALLALWQETPVVVAKLEGPARWLARAIFLCALPGFLWGARSIPQFDPFGTAPIRARLRGREPKGWPFTVRGPYRWVRHPQYFFTMVLIWAFPDLTADRLLFNGVFTAWVVLGAILEERDLVVEFGGDYVEYRRRVPMLIPWRGPRGLQAPTKE
jgi:protein-S-isoprenylcysteine O-methyltransferase Ste14